MPVVQTLEISQCDVHVRGIIAYLVRHPLLPLGRVARADALPVLLLRFIERGEQQHKKGQVIIEREPCGGAEAAVKAAAQPAVALPIPSHLYLGQVAPVCYYIAEHQTLASR